MAIPEAIRNNVISALVGAGVTWLATRLQSKTARLRYSTRVERIAVASNDPVFGDVAVTWGGNATRNLYLATVEVENVTGRDFDNVPFTVYVANDSFLLNEWSVVVNSPHIVPWSQGFKDDIAVKPGQTPTPLQSNKYYHCRDYLLSVFNRGQLLHFTYLCTRPNDDKLPEIFIATQLKGARVRHEDRSTLIFGVPNRDAMVRGWIISTVLVILCARWLRPAWVAIAVSYVIGLVVLLIGVAEYKAERWLRKLILG